MLATWKLTLYCFCVLIVAARSRDAARNRGKPPLIEEPVKKSKNRPTHCTFGNLTYELEERWRPDLGPPFGVLYCVRCECTAVRKKKRVTAKVRCRNIKYDCPKLTCHNPVLQPGRCCKTCPGQDYADLEEDLASKKFEDEEENAIKEFSALLTGRGFLPNVQTGAAARGYAILNKRNLHYTIHYSGLSLPTSVRFTDDEGTILSEHEVNALPKYVNESKVCGAWRSLPKIYRRLLHKDRLYIVLVTSEHPDGEVGGKLLKNMRFNTEVYSSLLLSDDLNAGSGGIATIAPVQDNVHVIIDFNGVFSPKDSHNVAVFIRINNRDDNTLLAEAVVIMPKVNPEYNRANMKMKMTDKVQKLLSEGKLEMTINSTDESKMLRGRIIVKPTCNVFQAVLTSEKLTNKAFQTTKPSGFVLFSINPDGALNYKLHVVDSEHEPSSILFQTDADEGVSLGEIDNLDFSGEWANGTFAETNSQLIEMLMTDDLYLSVSTSDDQNKLRGRIRQRLYTDAFVSEMPLLLSSKGNSSAAGIAWLSVDKDCLLHYEVDVSNLDQEGSKSDRHLVEILQKSDYNSRQQVLKKLDGDEVEDRTEIMAIYTLKSGNSQVLITTKSGREKSIELKGTIDKIYVPANCLLRSDPMQQSTFPYMEDGSNEILRDSSQCYYEGKIFADGTQWKAEHNPCWMCSCQASKVVCDSVICPPTTCNNPVTLPSECCPSCYDANVNGTAEEAIRGCYFEGDKKFHSAGSQWHPYIPPFGFSTCAICTCQPDTLTVECQKTVCPPLSCPDHKAVRADPLACCKTCKNEVVESPPYKGQIFGGTLGDQAELKQRDILLEGGCKTRGQIFANGAEWHPTVQPFGEMKCVNCHCKDGQSKCRRQKCPKLACDSKIYDESECCPRCPENGKLYNENHPSKKEKRKWKIKNKRQIS
ncbi:dorsal-ventral patterning protein Sog isoform X2 [Centruroides vittatus]|uniref:dorsal-ventral patterning protein Sog isoform X2 n=1 Tax=Centruroides vittatus TaxID=120091 RepID=UPI00350FAB0E